MAELVDAHDSKSCFARSESSILSSPTIKNMNLDNLNNLIELFSHQAEKQNKESIFLQWLNPNNKKSYTWEETQKNILKYQK